MKSTLIIAAIATATIGLSGCDKKADTLAVEASKASRSADAMAMPAGAKMGKATGTVTAIDAAAGKITLDHGAIAAVGWPAMNMAFLAKPALLDGITVGDKVAFDVTVTGNGGEVTAISKQ